MKSNVLVLFSIVLSFSIFSPVQAAVTKAKPAPAPSVATAAFHLEHFNFGAPSTGVEKLNDVTLSDTAKFDLNGKSIELKRVAAGLRQKKVALFWASVYAGQIFTNGAVEKGSADTLRDSLLKNLPVVVSMTFVRDVGIDKIVDAYKEVFTENGIKADAAPFTQFLEGVQKSGDVKNKQTYWFVFSKENGKQQFSFLTNDQEYFSLSDASPETMKSFMLMWLGKPADSGLEKLQQQFIK